MAVVDRNSTEITNMVAVPIVKVNPSAGGASALLEVAGYVANAADDDATSIHRFCRVPSNARVSQVILTAGNATSAGALDVGLYQTAENGGAAVDVDLFAAAQILTSSSAARGLDVTYESTEYTAAESIKPLWEVIGLSADPQIEYDVAATITTTYNGAAVGQVLKVRYVV